MKIKEPNKILAASLIALASLLMAGCADDFSKLIPEDYNTISFRIESSGNSRGDLTRGFQDNSRYSAFRFDEGDMWVLESESDLTAHPFTANYSFGRAASMPQVLDVDKFYMHAYVFEGSGDYEDKFGVATTYLSDEVTKSGDNLWSSATPRYWPGEKYTIKFFGHTFLYADKIDETTGEIVTGSRQNSDGAEIRLTKNWPSAKYDSEKCNDDLVITSDIMPETTNANDLTPNYIKTLPGNYNKPVNLHFYHALTAITFTADESIENEIVSIKISGIRTVGKHTYGDDSWSFYASDGTEYVKSSLSFDLTKSSEKIRHPKMVIPQELTDAVLSVEFTDGSTLTKSLSNKRWQIGTSITYRISRKQEYTEWVLEGLDDITLSWMGGDVKIPVRSYLIRHSISSSTNTVETTIERVPWSASPQAASEWITVTNDSGIGVDAADATPEYFTAVVSRQTSTYSNEHDDKLRATPAVSGIYDLSTNGGTTPRSTANCYLVNAPGQYTLPLVYGNAITDGEVNTKCYYPPSVNNGNSSWTIFQFKAYDRSAISTPYIYEQHNGSKDNYKDKITDAILCWQDAEDLVTNIRLDSEKQNLLFDVNSATIKQGNALIAIRDSQQRIMWSWHIWVTDYVLGTEVHTVTNQGVPGVPFTVNEFMPYNLGHCYAGRYEYDARKDNIVITQRHGDETRQYSCTISQKEHVFQPTNNTYYQWGRKDPMLPGYSVEDGENYDPITGRYQLIVTDKTQYYTDERYKFCMKGATASNSDLAIAMQNPNVFFTSDANWCNWMVINLWNGTNLGDVCKTVYDPCPPGFAIPSAKVFTGFTRTGDPVIDIDVNDPAAVERIFDEEINSYLRSIEDFARNFGFSFYCNPMISAGVYDTAAGTIHFPTIGYRPGDGSSTTPAEVGHFCFLWSTNPDYSKRAAWYMMFGISETTIDIVPRARDESDGGIPRNLANGFSIRPIREY